MWEINIFIVIYHLVISISHFYFPIVSYKLRLMNSKRKNFEQSWLWTHTMYDLYFRLVSTLFYEFKNYVDFETGKNMSKISFTHNRGRPYESLGSKIGRMIVMYELSKWYKFEADQFRGLGLQREHKNFDNEL